MKEEKIQIKEVYNLLVSLASSVEFLKENTVTKDELKDEINGLRGEMNQRFDEVDRRFNEIIIVKLSFLILNQSRVGLSCSNRLINFRITRSESILLSNIPCGMILLVDV